MRRRHCLRSCLDVGGDRRPGLAEHRNDHAQGPGHERTDADTLTWLLTFTEPVTNVDTGDFAVTGTTAALSLTPLALDDEGCSVRWDATLSAAIWQT